MVFGRHDSSSVAVPLKVESRRWWNGNARGGRYLTVRKWVLCSRKTRDEWKGADDVSAMGRQVDAANGRAHDWSALYTGVSDGNWRRSGESIAADWRGAVRVVHRWSDSTTRSPTTDAPSHCRRDEDRRRQHLQQQRIENGIGKAHQPVDLQRFETQRSVFCFHSFYTANFYES